MVRNGVEVASPREILELKLSLWSTRLQYAKGKRKAECQLAVDDLRNKLAAL